MSNVETRKVWGSQHVTVETLANGKPLGRPIYFKWGVSGWYMSAEQAEALAEEFTGAVAAARRAGKP